MRLNEGAFSFYKITVCSSLFTTKPSCTLEKICSHERSGRKTISCHVHAEKNQMHVGGDLFALKKEDAVRWSLIC